MLYHRSQATQTKMKSLVTESDAFMIDFELQQEYASIDREYEYIKERLELDAKVEISDAHDNLSSIAHDLHGKA
jgi:hypothetical protein